MSYFFSPIVVSAPFKRSAAIAALMGATMLVSPLAARAANTSNATFQLAAATAPQKQAAAAERKAETVEQRITTLHASLKITPDEETNWTGVAQAMRENAANMQKLVAEKKSQPAEDMTAVDDLKTYEQFAHAHVEGLKNLIASFETLYNAMPDDQKKIADQVFQNGGHKGTASHS
jgi:protein CpxP